VDSYAVCSDCLLRLEALARERDGDGIQHLPRIVGDEETRLRRLLDDW
jgi:hypothetical protein